MVASLAAADAPDPHNRSGDRTLFHGAFYTGVPRSGAVKTIPSFAQVLRRSAYGADGQRLTHFRSDKLAIAFIEAYLLEASTKVPQTNDGFPILAQAVADFFEINCLFMREGRAFNAHRLLPRLGARVTEYLALYGDHRDSRIIAYCRFLIQAHPRWSNPAAVLAAKERLR
jgi:hypothetical protein